MARAFSLHIGLNRVEPAHYDGWDGALNACEADAQDMHAIAHQDPGFESTLLLTEEATAEAIIRAIEDTAGKLDSGDLLWLTYSGHGGQVPDRNSDEDDRSDETWLAFDRQIADDELFGLWARFRPGVRIVVLSDSCHSGSVLKKIDAPVPDVVATRETAAAVSPRFRAMPRDVMTETYRAHRELYDGIQRGVPSAERADLGATALLISGCQDDQLSLDGIANGRFTETLLEVWDGGAWSGGGYEAFHGAIRSRMPDDQRPNYMKVGAANPEFEQQKPFSIG